MERIMNKPTAMTTQDQLRQTIARLEAAAPGSRAGGRAGLARFGIAGLDDALGGGLAAGCLHEWAGPAGTGLCLRLMADALPGPLLWAGTSAGFRTAGYPYGPGLSGLGLDPGRLHLVLAREAAEALWAAEEALRCPALAAVVLELPGDGRAADLIATRRLALAAREGGAFAFLVRHRALTAPVAATSRWRIAAAPGPADGLGGLGATAFDLHLTKNRHGPTGRWRIVWSRDDRCFSLAAPPLDLAAPAGDRPDRAGGTVFPLRHAG
ncbi:hypothetical protein DKG74_02910 [Zavarzinia aquatilis]|uniref:Protein ImuA n=2 Tax=Zavarzinia aquatilis TaxID=2211142 RepID=A0A317EHZ7_9PROT|nr:hypothetical protein DKG74_02910 [Zavarzinia aquatilis]